MTRAAQRIRPRFAATRRGALPLLLAVLLSAQISSAQSDNFDDGTDTNWTHYDPIAAFGYPASYTFPSGGYHILAPGTGDPFVGGGRAGSLREDATYTSFQVATDLSDLDPSHHQAIGLFSRLTTPGLFTTNAFALTYDPQANTLTIYRVDGEVLKSLDTTRLTPPAPPSLRLVFRGVGPSLAGQIFDTANTHAALAAVAAIDRTYDHGVNGLLLEDTGDGNHGAAATFDNYAAVAIDHFPGDANLDGVVDFHDLLALSQHYETANGATLADGDFNADGKVDFADLTILAQTYGSATSAVVAVPEPSVLALLLTSSFIIRRVRRSAAIIAHDPSVPYEGFPRHRRDDQEPAGRLLRAGGAAL